MKKTNSYIFVFALGLVCLVQCKVTRFDSKLYPDPDAGNAVTVSNRAIPVSTEHIRSETGVIMMFSYLDSGGLTHVKDTIIDHYLQINTNSEDTAANERLRFIFLRIDTLDIRNPLIKTVETFNKDYSISGKQIRLNKTEFSVNFPWLGEMDSVIVQEIKDNIVQDTLLIFRINY